MNGNKGKDFTEGKMYEDASWWWSSWSENMKKNPVQPLHRNEVSFMLWFVLVFQGTCVTLIINCSYYNWMLCNTLLFLAGFQWKGIQIHSILICFQVIFHLSLLSIKLCKVLNKDQVFTLCFSMCAVLFFVYIPLVCI